MSKRESFQVYCPTTQSKSWSPHASHACQPLPRCHDSTVPSPEENEVLYLGPEQTHENERMKTLRHCQEWWSRVWDSEPTNQKPKIEPPLHWIPHAWCCRIRCGSKPLILVWWQGQSSSLRCNASNDSSSKRNVHVPGLCAMAPNRHKTHCFPSRRWFAWAKCLWWLPAVNINSIGHGLETDCMEPDGEVLLKELIRLQITFPNFLFYWFHSLSR